MKRRRKETRGTIPLVYTLRTKRERQIAERFADALTSLFGSVSFLCLNTLFFIVWILWNLNLIPNVVVFDPYPFGMLTMVVSLEAIFLSVIVLMSQNRSSRIDEIRDEVDFQVNVWAEKEITRVLDIVSRIEKKLDIEDREEKKLRRLRGVLDLERLEDEVVRGLKR